MYTVQPADPIHMPFILSSYLHSRWAEEKQNQNKEEWYTTNKLFFIRILSDPTTNIMVAADTEDPTQIYGWICTDDSQNIIWGYIKKAFRKEFKILESLTRDMPTTAAYMFKSSYLKNKTNYAYDPILLRRYADMP